MEDIFELNEDKTILLEVLNKNVTEIVIPEGVEEIEEDAFFGCSSLKSVSIPNSVTFIGDGAFMDCSSLEYINIPNSVTSIGFAAFRECI